MIFDKKKTWTTTDPRHNLSDSRQQCINDKEARHASDDAMHMKYIIGFEIGRLEKTLARPFPITLSQ